MLDELLIEYADRFDDNFPIFCLLGFDDNEITMMIQKCLAEGEPFEPDYCDESVVY